MEVKMACCGVRTEVPLPACGGLLPPPAVLGLGLARQLLHFLTKNMSVSSKWETPWQSLPALPALPLPAPETTHLPSLWISLIWTFRASGILQCVALHDRRLSRVMT